MDYFAKSYGSSAPNLAEPLKIYSVQSKILSSHLLFLGTSYGPMVLSFPLSSVRTISLKNISFYNLFFLFF
jgi:hypothetical protein